MTANKGAAPVQAEGRELIVTSDSVFSLTDRLDEEAFVAELHGKLVEEYIYEIEQWNPRTRQKETVAALSAAGVDAACQHLADRNVVIREMSLDCVIDRVAEEATFHAKAGRYKIEVRGSEVVEILLDTAIGTKRQPMRYPAKGQRRDEAPKGDVNPHWYEAGARKACRNARRRLIAEAIFRELVKSWKGEKGRVRRIEVAQEQPAAPAEAPAKSTADAAKEEASRKRAWQEVLNDVRRELDTNFGPGAPWEHEGKKAVLQEVFGTSHWKSITAMPPGTGLGHYSREKLTLAISGVLEGAQE